jgi:hypothetical protein
MNDEREAEAARYLYDAALGDTATRRQSRVRRDAFMATYPDYRVPPHLTAENWASEPRRAITGRVSAFVPEHCEKRARASIRSDADFGSGPGIADRSPAVARRLAVALPWGSMSVRLTAS